MILSNLVSNVPAVLLLKPVVTALPRPRAGGQLTLVGSLANPIVAEGASRRNVELKFWESTGAGRVITLLTLAIAIGWIQLFIWK